MTTLIGLHHLALTVSDVERSAAWYREVLGFTRIGEYGSPEEARRKIFLHHQGLGVRIGLVQHHGNVPGTFDETRIGLDHLAFAVTDHHELRRWDRLLHQHRVPHSPPTAAHSVPGAEVLVFRDLDNIQLEFFADPTAAGPRQRRHRHSAPLRR